MPAALGYIAIATSSSQALRGKVVARFEVATSAAVGVGSVAAGFLYSAIGPTAFYVNALVYGITFLILRYGVEDLPEHVPDAPGEETVPDALFHLGRYRDVLRNRPVWLLAPDLDRAQRAPRIVGHAGHVPARPGAIAEFSDQVLMQGIEPWQASLAFGIGLLVLFSACCTGGTASRPAADHDHRARAGRRRAFVAALFGLNHSTGLTARGCDRHAASPPSACSSWPGPPPPPWASSPTSARATPAVGA